MLSYQTLAFNIHGKYIKSYKNDKFKIFAPTWSEKFMIYGSYSVSDIQDKFDYHKIIENHKRVVDNPPIRIYVNKIESKITFKIKAGC